MAALLPPHRADFQAQSLSCSAVSRIARCSRVGDTPTMDPLSTLLLAMGTALDCNALTRVADELEVLPAADAAVLAGMVRELASIAPERVEPPPKR